MPGYKRGERVERLGVYHFTMQEPGNPDEEEDGYEDGDEVDVKRPCSCKRCVAISVIVFLSVVAVVLTMLLAAGILMPWFDKKVRFPATPPLGWTSRYKRPCSSVTDHWIRQIISSLEVKGLKQAGYHYIVLDGCWQGKRNKSGYIQPSASQFPGQKAALVSLGRFIHQEGLKFGLSTSVGMETRSGKPGSAGYEEQDAALFSYWRADYIHAENHQLPSNSNASAAYSRLHSALASHGRPLIISMDPAVDASRFGHVHRVVTWDMLDDWDDMIGVLDYVNSKELWRRARPGFWYDYGPLVIDGAMTNEESRSHFALWCVLKSQLFIGTDLGRLSAIQSAILKNKDLLAISQDALGVSARLVHEDHAKTSHSRMVSEVCLSSDQNQQWQFSPQNKKIVHRASGQCLTKFRSIDVILDKCSPNNNDQQWDVDLKQKIIRPFADKHGYRLTLSTRQGVSAKIRPNSKSGRNTFQARDQWKRGFEDTFLFRIVDGAKDTYNLENTVPLCAAARRRQELQIYAGPLSEGRYVALLLNRGSDTERMVLKLDYIHGLDASTDYILKDVFDDTEIPVGDGQHQTEVPEHSVKVYIIREAAPSTANT